jgi:hypothetical protein
MDNILRDARKRERRGTLTTGVIALAGGLTMLVIFRVLLSSESYTIYFLPTGTVAFGVSRIVRGLSSVDRGA